MNKTSQLKLADLDIMLATRETASFVVSQALKKKANAISFSKVNIVSRSFLDEIYIQSKENSIQLVDISAELQPLYNVIDRSHRDQKMYAPKIKVEISNTIFA